MTDREIINIQKTSIEYPEQAEFLQSLYPDAFEKKDITEECQLIIEGGYIIIKHKDKEIGNLELHDSCEYADIDGFDVKSRPSTMSKEFVYFKTEIKLTIMVNYSVRLYGGLRIYQYGKATAN